MTKIAVFAGGHLTSFPRDFAVFVGVDRGSLAILRNDLPLDLAVGDFDSVTAAERQLIQEKAKMVITAVPEKDDTDTLYVPVFSFLKNSLPSFLISLR